MGYTAKVFRILIASPSDVSEERDLISRVIQEWNDLYSFERKIVLLPLKWETHSSPELGARPQDVINREVVDFSDMAIGVFWTKIGTPTGKFESGTIEEIDRVGKDGKTVMLYFSKAKVELDNVDLEQYQKLKEFKVRTYPNGLVENYSNIVEFRDKLAKQLEIKLRTLIAKEDKDDGSEIEDFSTIPKLELGFWDVNKHVRIQDKLIIQSKLLTFTNIDDVPDYKEKEVINKKGTSDINVILGGTKVNKDYYRDYLSFYKQQSLLNTVQYSLFNSGQIGIRNIYIEIRIEKKDNIIIAKNKPQSPKMNDYHYGSFLSGNNNEDSSTNEFILIERKNHYLVKLSYDALQPKREINIRGSLYIGSSVKQVIECPVLIYAECFPTPIETNLTIETNVEEFEFESSEFLEEMKIKK